MRSKPELAEGTQKLDRTATCTIECRELAHGGRSPGKNVPSGLYVQSGRDSIIEANVNKK